MNRVIKNFATQRKAGQCPNCPAGGLPIADQNSGDEVCAKCGLVIEERMLSEEQEWRSFSNDGASSGNDRNRVGGPNNVWLDNGIQGTTVVGGNKRLRFQHDCLTSAIGGDRLLTTAFSNLKRMADAFSLKECVIERCKEIVKELQFNDKLKSRTGDKYMLGIVYMACREEQIFRTLKELAVVLPSGSDKDLGRVVNTLKKLLPMRGAGHTQSSAELMGRFCGRLRIPAYARTTAEHVARTAESLLNKGFKPASVAGGVILFTCTVYALTTTISEISATAKTAESTIRNVFKTLCQYKRSLLPRDCTPKIDIEKDLPG